MTPKMETEKALPPKHSFEIKFTWICGWFKITCTNVDVTIIIVIRVLSSSRTRLVQQCIVPWLYGREVLKFSNVLYCEPGVLETIHSIAPTMKRSVLLCCVPTTCILDIFSQLLLEMDSFSTILISWIHWKRWESIYRLTRDLGAVEVLMNVPPIKDTDLNDCMYIPRGPKTITMILRYFPEPMRGGQLISNQSPVNYPVVNRYLIYAFFTETHHVANKCKFLQNNQNLWREDNISKGIIISNHSVLCLTCMWMGIVSVPVLRTISCLVAVHGVLLRWLFLPCDISWRWPG